MARARTWSLAWLRPKPAPTVSQQLLIEPRARKGSRTEPDGPAQAFQTPGPSAFAADLRDVLAAR